MVGDDTFFSDSGSLDVIACIKPDVRSKGHMSLDSTSEFFDTPWCFKCKNREREYRADYIREIYDRARPIGIFTTSGLWIFRIIFFCSRFVSGYVWDTREILITLARLCLISIYTFFLVVQMNAEQKRKVGILAVWLMRLVAIPLELVHELGVPQHFTQLASMQVCD